MPPSRRPVPWHALELRHGALTLRALRTSDGRAWAEVRRRNHEWLREWEATRPPEDSVRGVTFRSMVRDLRRQAREGRCLPFAILVNGSFAGQITVSSIVGGSAQFANVGYWIDQRHAGHGYTPLAVALVTDHCWFGLGLHRMEVAIRPENVASLRVVEKLGFTEIGYAPKYLHINGAWRDHRLFALTTEEVPGGLLRRLLDQQQA